MQTLMLVLWIATLAGGCLASVYFLKKLNLYNPDVEATNSKNASNMTADGDSDQAKVGDL